MWIHRIKSVVFSYFHCKCILKQNYLDIHVHFLYSYIRPANIGDELFIEGKILKVGKNLAFLTVDVKNKVTGQIIAIGKHTKFVGEQSNATASAVSTVLSGVTTSVIS